MKRLEWQSRREGFALAAAVLVMLVVGAIVTGGFYAVSQEGQISKSTDAGDMALYIAENGLTTVTGSTTASTLSNMAINSQLTWNAQNVTFGGRTVGSWTANLVRLNHALFYARVTGTVSLAGPYAGATRQVAQLIRLRKALFDHNTAFQVYGNLTVSGNSDVNGNDTYPSSWTAAGDVCTTKTGTSAVTANPSSVITIQGGAASITGPVTRQTMDSTAFKVFGDYTYADIAALADFTYANGTLINPGASWSGSTCNRTVTTNWGAPLSSTNPCYRWYPIMHATGDLHISSSATGQGILLVDGNLDVTGGFQFYGAVVVLGSVSLPGTGGHINGSVLAFGGGNLGSTSVSIGNSLVQYSSCSIDRAVLGSSKLARGYPIAEHSWVDLSSVLNGY